MKRVVVVFLLIFVTFILQSSVLKALAFSGVMPNGVLMIVSCFGFMRGQNEGMLVGFTCGLLTDIFFGGGVIGMYALIYTIMGYLNGYFHRVFYPEDVKLPILFVTVSDFTYSMIVYVMLFLLRRRIGFFSYLKHVMLPEAVYTVLLTLLVYRIVLGINVKLEKEERENESIFV